MGTIIVGIIVFGILAAVSIRLILNIRKGKTGCSCGGGCSSCAGRRTG